MTAVEKARAALAADFLGSPWDEADLELWRVHVDALIEAVRDEEREKLVTLALIGPEAMKDA